MQALNLGHTVELLQGGEEFFPALVQALDESRLEVRLETYIFNLDASGKAVAEALLRAAARGVAVYLVIDGAGTLSLPRELADRFTAAGLNWRIFSPLGGLGWFVPRNWRRLHRKLCVVDGQIAFCGGINVLDDFYDPNHGALNAPRFDFAVRVSGPLVRDAQEAVTQFWLRLKATRDARELDFASAWAALQSAMRLHHPMAARSGEKPGPGTRAALVLRDNFRNRTRIERAYRKAIGAARSEIIIANAYFVPGLRLRSALVHAARRGVRVRLLLQGKYEYFMQYHAARPVFGALLEAGVEIHEYSASFLHAKVAVVDARWATVGSSNLDPLSMLLAREANVVVDDAPFASELRRRLDVAMQTEGRQLDPSVYAHRPWSQRFMDGIAYWLMRGMLFLNGSRY